MAFEDMPKANALPGSFALVTFLGGKIGVSKYRYVCIIQEVQGENLKANRVQSPAVSPDFNKWELCQTMPLVCVFSLRSPVFPAPSFRRRSISTSITLIGFQDLAIESHPDLFTPPHSTSFFFSSLSPLALPHSPPLLYSPSHLHSLAAVSSPIIFLILSSLTCAVDVIELGHEGLTDVDRASTHLEPMLLAFTVNANLQEAITSSPLPKRNTTQLHAAAGSKPSRAPMDQRS
ncbi:hypothetical protein PR048_005113 [Dryococelus australis]|uniref:Uncharacterized protein n=1 Tax=Dryococelus australis TaxID=614101 RepID=A0ABQ9I7A3_9NEOP|nr:hypothetical protein PR048_005113 [Dryococelus australis]